MKHAVALKLTAFIAAVILSFLSGCRSERATTTPLESASDPAKAAISEVASSSSPASSTKAPAVSARATPSKHDGAGKTVSVLRLQPRVLPISMVLPGRVLAYETSDVRPQVSGIVQRRCFVEGALVKAGQPLYQIEPARYELAYEQATAALAGARAAVPLARSTLARERGLLASGATSRQVHDQAVATLAQAEAALASAQAAQRRARLDRDFAVVRVPIGGYIDRSNVSAGALVVAEQVEPLTRIHRIDRVYVDLRQSSEQLRSMRRTLEQSGALTGKASKVTLTLSDGEPYPQTGRLDLTESRVALDTDTVALRAVFDNPERTLLPGMYVRANVTAGTLRDGYLLPQRAVSRNARGEPSIWVVVHGKAEQRTLPQAQPYGNDWLVNGGITPGTLLIVEGEMHVREGATVAVEEVRIDPGSGLLALPAGIEGQS